MRFQLSTPYQVVKVFVNKGGSIDSFWKEIMNMQATHFAIWQCFVDGKVTQLMRVRTEDLQNALQEEAELRLSWDELALVGLTEKSELPVRSNLLPCRYVRVLCDNYEYFTEFVSTFGQLRLSLGTCDCLSNLSLKYPFLLWCGNHIIRDIHIYPTVVHHNAQSKTQSLWNAHQGCFLIRDVGVFYLTHFLSVHSLLDLHYCCLHPVHLCKLNHQCITSI